MKFAVIRPHRRELKYFDAFDTVRAQDYVGLPRGEVDHGTVKPGVGIVVYEHALSKRPQSYFSICRRLYGGPALLYGFDVKGATIDLAPFVEPIMWLADQEMAEIAISLHKVERPRIAIGDKVFWQWPDPMPDQAAYKAFCDQHLPTHGTVIIDDVIIMRTPTDEEKRP
jgi:hypothetical protein